MVRFNTGTSSSAIGGVAMHPTDESGFVDLQLGVFYRRGSTSGGPKNASRP